MKINLLKNCVSKYAALAIIIAVTPVMAFAHAYLKKSEPVQGATLTTAPAEVTLEFSEELETQMSKIQVKNSLNSEIVSTGKPSDGGKGLATLQIKLIPLKTDQLTHYIVSWKAVSKDSHRMPGSFEFSVAPVKK